MCRGVRGNEIRIVFVKPSKLIRASNGQTVKADARTPYK